MGLVSVWVAGQGPVLVCDPAKVHPINHAGEFFRVRGPLSTVPSPQGAPVLIQAGGSPRGIKASPERCLNVRTGKSERCS